MAKKNSTSEPIGSVTFHGNGGVWDHKKNLLLCRFIGGTFVTADKHVIDTLVRLGYKHDGIIGQVEPPVNEE